MRFRRTHWAAEPGRPDVKGWTVELTEAEAVGIAAYVWQHHHGILCDELWQPDEEASGVIAADVFARFIAERHPDARDWSRDWDRPADTLP